jgi:NAD(P)-dependent dehydrogenase (short-subunit alcohol dehydrogenase family)
MSSADSLTGRRAVVTGAGRNVGEGIALALARKGAAVAAVDLDEKAVRDVAAELPGKAIAIGCDVSAEDDVRAMTKRAVAELGGIDILVSCVAITDRGHTVLDLPAADWQRVLDVSLTSAFLCTKYAGQAMVEAGTGGCILYVGSTSGYLARANAVAYPTAKAALYGLARSAALQLGRHGIRVNTVTPNKVGSPVGQAVESGSRDRRNLVGRACTPDDIGNAVAFLASDAAGFVAGTDLVVDGGALVALAAD